jgi:hypothetical protein
MGFSAGPSRIKREAWRTVTVYRKLVRPTGEPPGADQKMGPPCGRCPLNPHQEDRALMRAKTAVDRPNTLLRPESGA